MIWLISLAYGAAVLGGYGFSVRDYLVGRKACQKTAVAPTCEPTASLDVGF